MKKSFFIIIFLFLGIAVSASGFDSSAPIATAEAYFDIATGHKYIRNHDGSYAEYNKKGDLFRASLPNTQPHLATSKYIIEVTSDSYICYEKFIHNKVVQEFLPFSNKHPQGWKSKTLLMAVERSHRSMDIGLGYTKEEDLNSLTSMATGNAYFDLATGHKYIRNDNGSYAEYTAKGELFQPNVSNTQPHLVRSKYIVEIMPDHHMLYEKTTNNKVVQQVLPVSSKHPEGWRSKKLLMSVNKPQKRMDVGLGYTEEE